MKPFTLFMLLAFSLVHTSLAWNVKTLFWQLSLSRSRIPQFILDTRHPWLETNRKSLEGLKDPVQALCSLDSTIRPTNGTEADTYPPDLFRYLELDNNRHEVNRPGWANANLRLQEMLVCPAALQDVEDFKVEISVSDGRYDIGYPEPSVPPAHLPDLFIKVLSSMPSLRKLEWNTFGNGNSEFERAFVEADLVLPSVVHLVPAAFTDFLVNTCPNVEILETGQSAYWKWTMHGDARGQLMESTKSARNLTTFGMEGEWEMKYLEALLKNSPNITTLKMLGRIEPYWHSSRHLMNAPDGYLLKNYTGIISRFPYLENLYLPPSWALELGFDGGSGCGNAYFGPGGSEYGRQVSRESAEATDLAAEIVLDKLPNLKSLKIGGTCANITRTEHGVTASWPWSGRMEEWTYELWPIESMEGVW